MPTRATKSRRARPRYRSQATKLEAELLSLAKAGAPKPQPGTRLGNALFFFTTHPEEIRACGIVLLEMEERGELDTLKKGTYLSDALVAMTTSE
jgi:hypothetical protein